LHFLDLTDDTLLFSLTGVLALVISNEDGTGPGILLNQNVAGLVCLKQDTTDHPRFVI